MKNIQYTFILASLLLASCVSSEKSTSNTSNEKEPVKKEIESAFLKKHPLATWLRKTPAEIGCMLEEEFSYKDSVFNCSYKNYENKGDPCKNTKEYYEGIEFPANLTSKISPLIKDLVFDFEHGNLREIRITFKDSIAIEKVKEIFNLPVKKDFPENIMDIYYGENVYSKDKPVNPNYTRWLNIVGFEHMGAGDVDCE